MDNIRTILLDMPFSIRGYTILKDDFYTIIINSALSYEMQLEVYHHEMSHIQNGDFEKNTKSGLIELYAHNI